MVKYFRGGISSILKLNITLWPLPRRSDGEEIAFMIAIFGSPILVEPAAVRAAMDKYDTALDALVSPDAAVAAAVAEADKARHNRNASNHDGYRLLFDAEMAAPDGAAVEMMVASLSETLPQHHQVQDKQQPQHDQVQIHQHAQDHQLDRQKELNQDFHPGLDESASPADEVDELEPLTIVKLVYRPLLPIDPRKLHKFYLHPAYAVFFWTICISVTLMASIPAWNPVGVAHFTVVMISCTALGACEYGRLDRALLFHCLKSFDFMFLFAYLIGFVTFRLCTVLEIASAREDTRPKADIWRTNIVAKCVFLRL